MYNSYSLSEIPFFFFIKNDGSKSIILKLSSSSRHKFGNFMSVLKKPLLVIIFTKSLSCLKDVFHPPNSLSIKSVSSVAQVFFSIKKDSGTTFL